MERYIKEYANAKIKTIQENELIQPIYKTHAIERIANALKYRKRGMTTIDETIRAILESMSES